MRAGSMVSELDGAYGHLYGLSEEEYGYVISTFGSISESDRENMIGVYREME